MIDRHPAPPTFPRLVLTLTLAFATLTACSTDQLVRQRHETRIGLYVPELIGTEPACDNVTVLLTGGRSYRFQRARVQQDGVMVIVDAGRPGTELGRWPIADVRAVLFVDQWTRTD